MSKLDPRIEDNAQQLRDLEIDIADYASKINELEELILYLERWKDEHILYHKSLEKDAEL